MSLLKNTRRWGSILLLFFLLLPNWPAPWWPPRFPPTISQVSASNFPIVEATNTYQTNSTPTSHSVNLPTGIQAGDLLLVIFRAGSTATASIAGDWSLLASRNSTGTSYIWWKTANGTEGATVTVTTSTTIRAAANSYRISNWTGTPEAAFTGSNTNDPPTLSPSWGEADTLWIAGLTNRRSDSTVTGAPSNYSGLITISQTSSTGTTRSRVSSAVRSFVGSSENPGAFSTTGTIDTPHSFTIAVQPAALPTENSFQRKTWHDGTRYWRSYFDQTDERIEFEYSLDGATWTENTAARLTGTSSDFTIEADDGHAFVSYTTTNDVRARQASSYPNTNFSWGSEITVLDGASSTDAFSYPSLARDSSDYIWMTARYTGSNTYYIAAIKASSANTLPQDSSDDVHTLASQSNTNPTIYATLNPLSNQDMYVTYVESGFIKGATWDNSDSRFEDENGGVYDSAGSAWLEGWANRLKITVSNTNVDANLTHFPVLLTLGAAVGTNNADVTAIFDELGSSGQKIAITKADGLSQLYVEIETWDNASEQAWLWVSSNDLTISSSEPTTLYLYYDSTQSDNTSYVGYVNSASAAAVWDSSFKAVWHFSETSGTYYDSTTNNNDSTFIQVTSRSYSSSCAIGRCAEFSGTDAIEVTENNSLDVANNVTFQAQIDPDSFGNNGYGTIVDKDYATAYIWYLYGNSGYENFWLWSNAGVELESTSIITMNTLQSLATTYNRTNGIFYIDGANAGTDTSTAALGVNNNQVVLGNAYTANEGFDGHIDEIRISDSVRSAAWIKAEHYSQRDELVSWSSTAPSGGYDLIDTTTNLITQGISSLASNDIVHLSYIDSSGQTKYKQRTYSWQPAVVLDNNTTNYHPNIAFDQASGDVYAFWVRGSTIYYKKGTANYLQANFDETATTWQTSTDTLYVAAGAASGNNTIFVLWQNDSGVQWDSIALGSTIISVTITTDGVIAYGTLSSGESISTVELADMQSAQNDSNVEVDLNIKTIQPSGWTLGATAGSDVFVYEFSTNGGTDWTKFTTSDNYQTLATNVAVDGLVDFDLRLTAPNPSTDSSEKTITTIVQAVQN